MEMKSVIQLVREMEEADRIGQTVTSRYVTLSMREDIDTTEAYLNSKHISGDTDYLGREKPFFNIVIAARNILFRATDIDRKDIKVRATKEADEIPAFLASIQLQEWMRKANFGRFLNDWGLSLANHGSSILKFIEKDGELSCQVMDWNEMLVDAVDFDNNLKIEKLYFTPAQLKQQNYDQNFVDKLLDNLTTRKTMFGQNKDNKSDYILVYEVHGMMSLAQYKMSKGDDVEKGDDDEYFQQMHVISVSEKNDKAKDDDEGYTLYSGREAKDPYMITHLIAKDGITYTGGAPKNLFEAQWMVNHSAKQIKDQLDLASKIIFQTADGNFVGQNALTNIENGDILVHSAGNPLTQINNKPDIAAMQSSQASWREMGNQVNGIAESMIQQAKSGTAWRQTQAELQEAHSLFELMTENKGLAVVEMLTTYIIPYFKKQLNNSDEISATLEEYQIKEIDSRYVPNEAMKRVNQKKKETILSGKIYDPIQEGADMASATTDIQSSLKGNQRFIKPNEIESVTWKEVFKDLEWDLELDVTNEVKDVQGALSTLTSVLQTIATNPMVLQDPNTKLIFNRILSLSGTVSPLELTASQSQQTQPIQTQPALAGVTQ